MANNQRTPLFDWHTAHGAAIAPFHGWDMPLWYPAGAKKEHLSVLTAAGLFDTSHMGAVGVTGPGAFDLLQLCFTKDLNRCLGQPKAPLEPGRCAYGAILTEHGGALDDAIVYQLGSERYLLVVNSGMARAVIDHFHAFSADRAAAVTDISGRLAKIDIQGPASARILSKLLQGGSSLLQDMVYFSFKGDFDGARFSGVRLSGGIDLMISRTGYTGELGFELLLNPPDALRLWELLLEAGEELGLIPCGLASRDSLRAGAVLPLSQQDIGPWPYVNHPWHFALPFDKGERGFTKEFIGDIVLQLRQSAKHTLAFAGFDPRKVSVQDPALVIDSEENEIGVALSCVSDLAIGRINGRICSVATPGRPENFNPLGLCCGFVKVRSRIAPGTRVFLKDKRRKIPVIIVDDIRPDRTARRPLKEFLLEENI